MSKSIITIIRVYQILIYILAAYDGCSGYYYFVSNIPFSWNNAKQYCESKDMKLLSLESAEKDSNLVGFLEYHGINKAWTSGNDRHGLGSYTWASNNNAFEYTNWIFGIEPHEADRKCVFVGTNVFWGSLSGWGVEDCELSLQFICE